MAVADLEKVLRVLVSVHLVLSGRRQEGGQLFQLVLREEM